MSWYDVAMTEGITELETLKTKYASLQREWDSQQEHLGKLQGEIFKLRNQLQHQTSFCASLGSIMGNLVWKASRVPNVIDTLLAGVCNFYYLINILRIIYFLFRSYDFLLTFNTQVIISQFNHLGCKILLILRQLTNGTYLSV